jgi:hypothetical protein
MLLKSKKSQHIVQNIRVIVLCLWFYIFIGIICIIYLYKSFCCVSDFILICQNSSTMSEQFYNVRTVLQCQNSSTMSEQFYNVRTVLQSNIKIIERDKINTPNTWIHDCPGLVYVQIFIHQVIFIILFCLYMVVLTFCNICRFVPIHLNDLTFRLI